MHRRVSSAFWEGFLFYSINKSIVYIYLSSELTKTCRESCLEVHVSLLPGRIQFEADLCLPVGSIGSCSEYTIIWIHCNITPTQYMGMSHWWSSPLDAGPQGRDAWYAEMCQHMPGKESSWMVRGKWSLENGLMETTFFDFFGVRYFKCRKDSKGLFSIH